MPQAPHHPGDLLQVEGQLGGMDVSEAKPLKALEDENSRLKRLAPPVYPATLDPRRALTLRNLASSAPDES
jgi:hypothetical protein